MALTNETVTRPPALPKFQDSLARSLSAAEIGGLPKLETVSVKELADAANLTPETIRERLKLWLSEPNNPLAIPFFAALGKPYQIPADWCRNHLLTLTKKHR